jgi:hypothetical protein
VFESGGVAVWLPINDPTMIPDAFGLSSRYIEAV